MRSTWIPFFFFAVGCGTDLPAENGQFGEEHSDPCEVLDRVAIPWDESVEIQTFDGPVSFVPNEVLVASQGVRSTELTYGDHPEYEEEEDEEPTEPPHPTTTLSAELTHEGAPLEWVTFEPAENLQVLCADQLVSTGTVAVSTTDGALDETYVAEIRVTSDGVHVQHGITDPEGSVDPSAWLTDVHATAVRISLFFGTDDTLTGSLDGVDPSGDFEEDAPSFGFFW